MSNKIGGGQVQQGRTLPWDDSSLEEVRQVRKAITEKLENGRVSDDLAPMMGELLARMDEIVGRIPESDMAAPKPPDPTRTPSPEQVVADLNRALASIEQSIASKPEQAGRFQRMLTVLEQYVEMKQEVAHRAESGRSA